jgi:hypothetical protein
MALGLTKLNRSEYQENSWWSKVHLVHKAALTIICEPTVKKCMTSRNPIGLHGLLHGELYFIYLNGERDLLRDTERDGSTTCWNTAREKGAENQSKRDYGQKGKDSGYLSPNN